MKKLWETDFLSYYQNCDDEKRQNQVSILTTMFEENLEHMRHVENERMSLVTAVTALVAAILAFGSDLDQWFQQLLIYMAILLIIFIALDLTMRWNTAFDTHLNYAKGCYQCLQMLMLECDDKEKTNFCINSSEISEMYGFSIAHEKLWNQWSPKHTRGKFVWLYLFLIAIIVVAMIIVVVEHYNAIQVINEVSDLTTQVV